MNFTGYQPTSLAQLNDMVGAGLDTRGLDYGSTLFGVDNARRSGYFPFSGGSLFDDVGYQSSPQRAFNRVTSGEGFGPEAIGINEHSIRDMSPMQADIAATIGKAAVRGIDVGLNKTPIGAMKSTYNTLAAMYNNTVGRIPGLPQAPTVTSLYDLVSPQISYEQDLAHLAANMGVTGDGLASMDAFGRGLDQANADRIGQAMEGGEGGGPDHGGMSDVGGFGDPNGHEGFGGYA